MLQLYPQAQPQELNTKAKSLILISAPVVLLGSNPTTARGVAQDGKEIRIGFQCKTAVLPFYLCC